MVATPLFFKKNKLVLSHPVVIPVATWSNTKRYEDWKFKENAKRKLLRERETKNEKKWGLRGFAIILTTKIFVLENYLTKKKTKTWFSYLFFYLLSKIIIYEITQHFEHVYISTTNLLQLGIQNSNWFHFKG